jgi:hypothetical protein
VVVSPPLFSVVLSSGGSYSSAYAMFGVWLLAVRRKNAWKANRSPLSLL